MGLKNYDPVALFILSKKKSLTALAPRFTGRRSKLAIIEEYNRCWVALGCLIMIHSEGKRAVGVEGVKQLGRMGFRDWLFSLIYGYWLFFSVEICLKYSFISKFSFGGNLVTLLRIIYQTLHTTLSS